MPSSTPSFEPAVQASVRPWAPACSRRAWWRRLSWLPVVVLALALGALVYVFDRTPGQAQWLPIVASAAARPDLPVFGVCGPWLPSFVHALAFSLLTAAVLPRRALPAYGACAAWAAVNVVFELGQHAAVRGGLVHGLHTLFGDSAPVRALAAYFERGTFDGGDIAAAVAGALIAALLLRLSIDSLDHPHAT